MKVRKSFRNWFLEAQLRDYGPDDKVTKFFEAWSPKSNSLQDWRTFFRTFGVNLKQDFEDLDSIFKEYLAEYGI